MCALGGSRASIALDWSKVDVAELNSMWRRKKTLGSVVHVKTISSFCAQVRMQTPQYSY